MEATKFFALGGMQEIGKMTQVVEHENEIVIIDTGIKFANSLENGVEGIIPNYSYLKQNEKKIKGLFITHGHEDHIGGIPYLLQQVQVPKIYAGKLAIQYIKYKLKDKKIHTKIEFEELDKEKVFKFDKIQIDAWASQHSIPDSFGIRVRTPNGSIFYTGDFRFDYTPIGNLTDFAKLEQWSKEGIDIMTSDSTNSMYSGHSPTEQNILIDIEKFIKTTKGRLIFTTFASNQNRVKAVIDLAIKNNKKVCVFGRSMVNSIEMGKKSKFIDVAENTFIDKKDLAKYSNDEVLILSTGSQGEEAAALSRMSKNKHMQVHLKKNDVVLFSSSPIPGNRLQIDQLINQLYKMGAEAKEHKIDGVLHTSGHAYKKEHEKIFKIIKPKYFVPCHGFYRQSAVHVQTAVECGVKKENNFIIQNGEIVLLNKGKATISKEFIETGPIYIDGKIANSTTHEVIATRAKFGENGFINVITYIDREKTEIIGRTRIISRGVLYVKESQDVMDEIQKLAHGGILFTIKNNKNWTKKDITNIVKKRIEPFFYKLKRRNPVIVVSVLEKQTKK